MKMKKYDISILCSDCTKYNYKIDADNARSAWAYAGEIVAGLKSKTVWTVNIYEVPDILTWRDSAGSFAVKDCGGSVLVLDSEFSCLTEYRKPAGRGVDLDEDLMPDAMTWSMTYKELDAWGQEQFDKMARELEKHGAKVTRY